jgi:hypothetical protein
MYVMMASVTAATTTPSRTRVTAGGGAIDGVLPIPAGDAVLILEGRGDDQSNLHGAAFQS